MSNSLAKKLVNKSLRKGRVRSKVAGTAERPRLSVFVSNMHVSAQLINDVSGRTLASATTVGTKHEGTMTDKAQTVGTDIAKQAKKLKINAVVFDRNGRRYAGRLKALADEARKQGLEF